MGVCLTGEICVGAHRPEAAGPADPTVAATGVGLLSVAQGPSGFLRGLHWMEIVVGGVVPKIWYVVVVVVLAGSQCR